MVKTFCATKHKQPTEISVESNLVEIHTNRTAIRIEIVIIHLIEIVIGKQVIFP